MTSTLSELERKLRELERELDSVGRRGEIDADPAQAGWGSVPDAPSGDPGPPPPGATPFTAAWHASEGPTPITAAWNGTAAPPLPPAAAPPPPPAVAFPAPPPPRPLATDLQRQLDELARVREQLVASANSLVSELSRVLADLGAEVVPVAPAAPPDPASTVLSGGVVLEASPFTNVAALAGFESALARTPGVGAVSVRSLESGRATFDVELTQPTPLAAALRKHAAVSFTVAEVGAGRLVLAVAPVTPG